MIRDGAAGVRGGSVGLLSGPEDVRSGPGGEEGRGRSLPPGRHQDAARRGASDLRLVPMALAAWAAAALASAASGWVSAAGATACVLAAVLLLLQAGHGRLQRTRHGRRRHGRQQGAGGPEGGMRRMRPHVRLTAAASLLCAAAAASASALHSADLRRGPLPRLAEQHATVTVDLTVTEDPRRIRPRVDGARQTPGALLFRAEATHVTAHGSPGSGRGEPPGRQAVRTPVLVVVQQRDGPPPGQWRRLLPSTGLRAEARLSAPLRTGYGQDVAAVLTLREGGRPKVIRGPTALQRGAGSLRAGLREATGVLDGDARGLLPGLVVGDTSRLRPDLEEAFRATDMTHLLAVSGANLTIVLAVLIGPPGTAHLAERRGLAARLGVPLRGTAALGALVTLAFVVVCRPEPSVVRAAACGLIVLLALVTGRRRSLLPALAAAVLLLVLYDPSLAVDFGFLLSVLATGALLTVAPRWSAALRRRGVNGRLAEALAAAASAQLACAPVVVVLDSHVSLVAVPCNLLAEFAVAPATVLGFAALAAAPFAMPLAEALAWLAGWPADGIAALARAGAALPGAEIGWPGGWTGAGLLAAVTVAVLLLYRHTRLAELPARPWLCAAAASALLLAVVRPVPLVRPFTGWPPPGWRLVMCDVGQGDALVLATGRERSAVVVDAGPDPSAVDRCLDALGVSVVPLLVLTHFHADHVAGLPGVLEGRSVGAIQTTSLEQPRSQAGFVRRTARRAGVRVIGSSAGERRSVGELSWQALWPQPSRLTQPPGAVDGGSSASTAGAEGANDASITLLFRTGGMSLLLPGDLEPNAQSGLLNAYPALPPVDVLKVAHHGSAYQDARLLDRLRPRIALISCGADNPYGHPAPRTLAALRSAGALVRRTDRNGALAVTGSPEGEGRQQGAGPPAVVAERGSETGASSAEREPETGAGRAEAEPEIHARPAEREPEARAGPPAGPEPDARASPSRSPPAHIARSPRPRRGRAWDSRRRPGPEPGAGLAARHRCAGSWTVTRARRRGRRQERQERLSVCPSVRRHLAQGPCVDALPGWAGCCGALSPTPASRRVRLRACPAVRGRSGRPGPPGRPATARPRRRLRRRGPPLRSAAPRRRRRSAASALRRPPRPRPVRAAPGCVVRPSPRHCASGTSVGTAWDAGPRWLVRARRRRTTRWPR